MFKKIVGDNINPGKKGWGRVPPAPPANYAYDNIICMTHMWKKNAACWTSGNLATTHLRINNIFY